MSGMQLTASLLEPQDQEAGPEDEAQHQTLPILSASLVYLTTVTINLLVSIVAPFFPVHAKDHYNAGSFVIGAVFAT